jgi:hypothetical protein
MYLRVKGYLLFPIIRVRAYFLEKFLRFGVSSRVDLITTTTPIPKSEIENRRKNNIHCKKTEKECEAFHCTPFYLCITSRLVLHQRFRGPSESGIAWASTGSDDLRDVNAEKDTDLGPYKW